MSLVEYLYVVCYSPQKLISISSGFAKDERNDTTSPGDWLKAYDMLDDEVVEKVEHSFYAVWRVHEPSN